MVYLDYPTGNLKRMANVQLLYNNSKVQKQCTDLKTAKKLFGGNAALATSLFARINAMQQASVIKDIVMMPTFHFHKLSGNMDGFFAIDVKTRRDPWRIIIQPLDENEEPYDPCNIDEIAGVVRIVEVKEVSTVSYTHLTLPTILLV